MALASRSSLGKEVSFGDDRTLTVQTLEDFDFEGTDIGLFSPGGAISKVHAPRAAAAGCVVIDNTSHFRMEPDVPLVVPEVNPDALAGFRERNIIANPNCSTIQMVMALKPLHDLAMVRRVVVATYQSVSGAGREAMDELFDQTKGIYETTAARAEAVSQADRLQRHSADRRVHGRTARPRKSGRWRSRPRRSSTRRSRLPRPACACRCSSATRSRSMSSSSTTIDLEDARDALQEFEGVLLVDDPANGEYVTPIECVGEFGVLVSRLRRDTTVPSGLSMWVVADNLRKGAALNAVQIAELLVQEGHL